jgi:hypothetical protein
MMAAGHEAQAAVPLAGIDAMVGYACEISTKADRATRRRQ